MTAMSSYGTWANRVDRYSTGPDSDVLNYVNGGNPDWQELLEKSGALDEIKQAYRAAIERALPPSVSLCGEEFIGPREPDAGDFEGFLVDDLGRLDFKALIEEIDLAAIIEAHDPASDTAQ